MNTPLTLVPMTPAAAKAWHTLQKLMLKGEHGLDVAPHGAIVLLPLSKPELPVLMDGWDDRVRFSSDGTTVCLKIGQGPFNYNSFTKRYFKPEGWSDDWWKPQCWTFSMSRADSDGRQWLHSGGDYVMDDFGDLVEVRP